MLSSFEPGSSNINGDHDTVKVLARTDNTRIEQQRIHQLADQVRIINYSELKYMV